MDKSIKKIIKNYGLNTEERFVVYQLIRYIDDGKHEKIKKTITDGDSCVNCLQEALRGRIDYLEHRNTSTKEDRYINREYIRILRSYADEKTDRLDLIYRCIKECYNNLD